MGYNVGQLLDTLFLGTVGYEDMCREFRAYLVVTGDKASGRRDGEFFRRYVNSMSTSPRWWFRVRDCDSLARFTIAAALACNDLDDVWFG